jgi:hypothetical protein
MEKKDDDLVEDESFSRFVGDPEAIKFLSKDKSKKGDEPEQTRPKALRNTYRVSNQDHRKDL